MRGWIAAISLGWCQLAWAAPAAVLPSEAEWTDLLKGQVVTRNAPDLSPPGAYGWVEIAADKAKIWTVLNDPETSVKSSNAVTSCEKYRDDAGPGNTRMIGLAYVLNVAWTEVRYNVVREFHPAEDWMTWTLDPSRTSDLVHTSGQYVLVDGRTPGKVLLTYGTQTDSGRKVPQWISQYLTGRALVSYLEYVRASAER